MFPFTLELEPLSQLETKGAQCSRLLSLSGQTQGRAGRARFPLPSRNRSPISLLCRPVLWFSVDVSDAFGLKEYWCCQPGPSTGRDQPGSPGATTDPSGCCALQGDFGSVATSAPCACGLWVSAPLWFRFHFPFQTEGDRHTARPGRLRAVVQVRV